MSLTIRAEKGGSFHSHTFKVAANALRVVVPMSSVIESILLVKMLLLPPTVIENVPYSIPFESIYHPYSVLKRCIIAVHRWMDGKYSGALLSKSFCRNNGSTSNYLNPIESFTHSHSLSISKCFDGIGDGVQCMKNGICLNFNFFLGTNNCDAYLNVSGCVSVAFCWPERVSK